MSMDFPPETTEAKKKGRYERKELAQSRITGPRVPSGYWSIHRWAVHTVSGHEAVGAKSLPELYGFTLTWMGGNSGDLTILREAFLSSLGHLTVH